MRRAFLQVLVPTFLLTLLFLAPAAAMQGVRDGLTLWANAVIPALLPFYAATDLLQQCGSLHFLAPFLRPVCRLLRLPDNWGSLLFSGWLSGAPNGARLLSQVTDDASVCTRACACITVTSPLFLIGTAGQLLGNPMLGALVYGIHLLTAICNGLLWRSYGTASAAPFRLPPSARKSVLSALPEALRSASLSMLFIGSAIAFFSALTAVLKALGLIPALERVLSAFLPTDAVSALLAGFFEVSQGIFLAAQGRLALPLRLSLLCAFASFGGVSVLCQAKVFLKDRVHTSIYFFQRLTHAVMSFALCRVLCLCFVGAIPAAVPYTAHPANTLHPFSALLPTLCLICSLLPAKDKRPMKIHRP